MSQTSGSASMVQGSAPFAVVSSVLAAVSVWIYGTFPQEGNLFAQVGKDRPSRLLRRSALDDLPADLPDHKTMRAVLLRAMNPEADGARDTLITQEPEKPETVLKEAIAQILKSWNTRDVARLDADKVTELYLLHDLLHASPAEAGRKSERFLKPAQVLLIHEQLGAIRRQRADFDRQLAVFRATNELWYDMLEHRASIGSLREALLGLGRSDVDLWHRIVTEHRHDNPEHRDAALWIAEQPQCPRATVALYLCRLLLDGHLETAAADRRGTDNRAFVTRVRRVVEQWNRGVYDDDSLGLDPEDQLCGMETEVADALTRVAAAQQGPAWPVPQEIARAYPGRAPEPRPCWSIEAGRLRSQPRIGDYVAHLRLNPV